MKLFHVNVELDLVIWAESEKEARETSEDLLRDNPVPATTIHASEIDDKSKIPLGGWTDDCIPWNGKNGDDRTIGEVFESKKRHETGV